MFSYAIGAFSPCFSNSRNLSPRANWRLVTASKSSAPNWANVANASNCAISVLSDPATDFIPLRCADDPTRVTDMPELTAGRTPALNRSGSRKSWPSVIEMTFVGMYAETSPASVSMIGSAVMDPPPSSGDNLAARSRSRECR